MGQKGSKKEENIKRQCKIQKINLIEHFTVILRSSLEKVEQILTRPIAKFYRDDVNATSAELRQIKTRPVSFQMIVILLYQTKVTGVSKI